MGHNDDPCFLCFCWKFQTFYYCKAHALSPYNFHTVIYQRELCGWTTTEWTIPMWLLPLVPACVHWNDCKRLMFSVKKKKTLHLIRSMSYVSSDITCIDWTPYFSTWNTWIRQSGNNKDLIPRLGKSTNLHKGLMISLVISASKSTMYWVDDRIFI